MITWPFAVVPPTRPSRVANTRYRFGSSWTAVAAGPAAGRAVRVRFRTTGPGSAASWTGPSTRRACTWTTGTGSAAVRVGAPADGSAGSHSVHPPPGRSPRTSSEAEAPLVPGARVSTASTRSTGTSTDRAGRVSRPGAPASPWPSARALPTCARSGLSCAAPPDTVTPAVSPASGGDQLIVSAGAASAVDDPTTVVATTSTPARSAPAVCIVAHSPGRSSSTAKDIAPSGVLQVRRVSSTGTCGPRSRGAPRRPVRNITSGGLTPVAGGISRAPADLVQRLPEISKFCCTLVTLQLPS